MANHNQPKQRIPEKEAAPYIGMSTMFLRISRMRGDGPPYLKIGRSVRYDTADLDRWLESKRVEG
jgi:predicted DNA-binding transcriptional regulator AlpA